MNYISCPVPKTLELTSLYTSFKITFDSDYSFAGETHNFWEMVFVLDGELGVCAGDKILSLKKGDAILHEPMEFHRLWSEHQTCPTVFIITFFAETMPELNKRVFTIPENDLEYIDKLFSDYSRAYENDDISVKNVKRGKSIDAEIFIKDFESFMLKMIRKYPKKSPTSGENRSKSALAYMDIVRYLEDNAALNLSIDEIAQGCNMSRSNLKKTFSKYSGLGIMKYFTMVKVRQAEAYLNDGLSVGDTAAQLGFCDQNYFSTVFKKYNGLSPRKYVAKLKNKHN